MAETDIHDFFAGSRLHVSVEFPDYGPFCLYDSLFCLLACLDMAKAISYSCGPYVQPLEGISVRTYDFNQLQFGSGQCSCFSTADSWMGWADCLAGWRI